MPRAWAVILAIPAAAGLAATAGAAPAAICASPAGPSVPVVAVTAPFELEMADGTRVRLAGVGLSAPGEGDAAAAAHLRALVVDRRVRFDAAPPRFDRYGRWVARAARADGLDLSEALAAAGMALAGPAPHAAPDHPCHRRLLAAEAAAQAAGHGLWGDGTFAVEAASDPRLAGRAGRFAIVDGRIESLGKAGRWRYLNFGRRWSLDFTVTIAESEGAWPRGWGIGPAALQGSRVRVRGWLEEDDGGLVRLGRPEDLERLAGPAQR